MPALCKKNIFFFKPATSITYIHPVRKFPSKGSQLGVEHQPDAQLNLPMTPPEKSTIGWNFWNFQVNQPL